MKKRETQDVNSAIEYLGESIDILDEFLSDTEMLDAAPVIHPAAITKPAEHQTRAEKIIQASVNIDVLTVKLFRRIEGVRLRQPVLKGVDLNAYRGAGREEVRVTVAK